MGSGLGPHSQLIFSRLLDNMNQVLVVKRSVLSSKKMKYSTYKFGFRQELGQSFGCQKVCCVQDSLVYLVIYLARL